jgi:hypothetical protein
MKSNSRRPTTKCHGLEGLPLFDWRQTPPRRSLTPAGAYVARRFGVSAEITDVVAALAGLGPRGTGL